MLSPVNGIAPVASSLGLRPAGSAAGRPAPFAGAEASSPFDSARPPGVCRAATSAGWPGVATVRRPAAASVADVAAPTRRCAATLPIAPPPPPPVAAAPPPVRQSLPPSLSGGTNS